MESMEQKYAPDMLIRLMGEKHISAQHITLPFQHMSDIPDHGLRALLYGGDTAVKGSFPDQFSSDGRWVCYALTDSFQCHYFILPFVNGKTFLLIGPYISGILSDAAVRNVRRTNQLSPQETAVYRQYMAVLPRIYDTALLDAVFRSFCSLYFGENRFEIRSWEAKPVQPERRIRTTEKPVFREVETRYAAETVMMNGIAEGDYEKVLAVLDDLSVYGIESRTPNLFRDAANYMIIFNTICRISAYRGGVHPQELDRLSREYSFRIENASGFDELVNIRNDMVRTYCRLVSSERPVSRSLQVSRAAAYIAAHFHEPVTLAKTADELGITKTYLSAVFRRETGLTFSGYVRRQRLSVAADLLKTTDMTVDEISAYCGIADPNYFSRMFRKEYGMSATNYRSRKRRKA